MPIYVKNINSYPDIKKYLYGYYGKSVDKLQNVSILEISEDLWKKFKFNGYGYVVDANELLDNQYFLELACKNPNYYKKLPSDEHKRDVNLYRLWQKVQKDIFLVVKPSSQIFIIHELSHLLAPEHLKEFHYIKFNDEYLDRQEEQFSNLNEMRFAQEKNMTFEEYFKDTWPDSYDIITKYNNGDLSISKEDYDLCKMDERDYKKMWDYIQKIKKADCHSLVKTAQKLSLDELEGRYGKFDAYTISGDTYKIRTDLSQIGFKWWQSKKLWYLPAKKFNENIKNLLDTIGVDTTMTKIETKVDSVEKKTPEAKKDEKTVQKTEDEEMTKWYGFPINHNIIEYDLDFELDGEKHTEHIAIDRLFVPGKDSNPYHVKKSREYKGFPKYVVKIGSPDNPIATMNYISKTKWGTYNEWEYLEGLKDTIKKRLENNPPQKHVSNAHYAMSWHYDMQKRTPELNDFLKKIAKREIKPQYQITIDDPPYQGTYPASPTIYSEDKPTSVYISTDLSDSLAPYPRSLGYSMSLHGIHTIDEFHAAVNEHLKQDECKKSYLKYLKSFPFLPHQKQESTKGFNDIKNILIDPQNNINKVFNKIKEIGYIRPHKRQKQLEGLTSGEEIKWVVDSKKIVNDAYSSGYASSTPDYFYAVMAYYIHRKIRGIWSWTDMMLVDTMSAWYKTMKRFGLEISFDEAEKNMEIIGNAIINIIYGGKKTKEEKDKEFFKNFYGYGDEPANAPKVNDALVEFKEFAQQHGVDPEGIEESNLKQIYRVLSNAIHPDKHPPEQQEEMTKEFQDLQIIWNKMFPSHLKLSMNWYRQYIFSQTNKQGENHA